MAIDIVVPTLGESVSDATIARWMKQAGEAVKQDEPIVELETDKVTLEVPSPVAGTLSEIVANEGVPLRLARCSRGLRKAPRRKLLHHRMRHPLRKRLQLHRNLQHLLLQRLGVNIRCHPLSVALSRKMTLTQTKSRERGWMAV